VATLTHTQLFLKHTTLPGRAGQSSPTGNSALYWSSSYLRRGAIDNRFEKRVFKGREAKGYRLAKSPQARTGNGPGGSKLKL